MSAQETPRAKIGRNMAQDYRAVEIAVWGSTRVLIRKGEKPTETVLELCHRKKAEAFAYLRAYLTALGHADKINF